jgi:peroxiredoxin
MKLIIASFLITVVFRVYPQSLNLDSLDRAIRANQESMLGTSFSFTMLTTLDGHIITSPELKEKVVVYNFWFTSCQACVAEIPALNDLKTRYQEVIFFGITFEPKENLKHFLKKHPFRVDLVRMSRREIESKVNFGYPTTIIVNKQGRIIYVDSGGPINRQKAFEAISQKVERKLIDALK